MKAKRVLMDESCVRRRKIPQLQAVDGVSVRPVHIHEARNTDFYRAACLCGNCYPRVLTPLYGANVGQYLIDRYSWGEISVWRPVPVFDRDVEFIESNT